MTPISDYAAYECRLHLQEAADEALMIWNGVDSYGSRTEELIRNLAEAARAIGYRLEPATEQQRRRHDDRHYL